MSWNSPIPKPRTPEALRSTGTAPSARHGCPSVDASAAATALAVAVRHAGQGVIALGSGTRVLYANEVARSCMGADGPLRLHQGRLAATAAARQGLSEALRRLEQSGRPQFFALHGPGGAGRAGQPARIFAVTALIEEQGKARQRILILDPFGERGPLDEAALSRWLDLTPAQARVAACLSRGLSPEEVAAHNGRSIATIRTQIRAILERTNLDNLQQLYRALAGLGRGSPAASR